MSKSILAPLVNALLDRVGSLFANLVLRRAATLAALIEAEELATLEQRARALQKQGHTIAATRIETQLASAAGDDPSYEITTCFGRQLLADTYAVDTPELRGEVNKVSRKSNQRPNSANGRASQGSR